MRHMLHAFFIFLSCITSRILLSEIITRRYFTDSSFKKQQKNFHIFTCDDSVTFFMLNPRHHINSRIWKMALWGIWDFSLLPPSLSFSLACRLRNFNQNSSLSPSCISVFLFPFINPNINPLKRNHVAWGENKRGGKTGIFNNFFDTCTQWNADEQHVVATIPLHLLFASTVRPCKEKQWNS